MTTSTIHQQSTKHPLDPLTAREIEETTRILRASGRITPRMRIMAYSLLEPSKDVVLNFQPGQVVPDDPQRQGGIEHEQRHRSDRLVDLRAGMQPHDAA